MPSIPSHNRLPRWAQVIFIIICTGLAVVYLAEPLRHQPINPIESWLKHIAQLVGIRSSGNEMLLTPSTQVNTGAQPLADIGSAQFLGCDRAGQSDRLYLVTYWRGVESVQSARIHLRFVLPDGSAHEVTQDLSSTALLTPLPDQFYAADRPGEIWLERQTDDDNRWVRICN